ncbi:MAG: pyruvoyl-dependent arginine decarboxylase [Candidatus Njordarchaeales archaeon]
MLITIPRKIYLAAVSAEGETDLNAFDACLVKAGLPQVSLIKVTSILPPNIQIVTSPPLLPLGCNVPSIYAYTVSEKSGEIIAGALAIGWTGKGPTLVAELAERGLTKEEAEKEAYKRLIGMAKIRGLNLTNYKIISVEHEVKKCGCVLVIAAQVG